jgi:hypothetical protein
MCHATSIAELQAKEAEILANPRLVNDNRPLRDSERTFDRYLIG